MQEHAFKQWCTWFSTNDPLCYTCRWTLKDHKAASKCEHCMMLLVANNNVSLLLTFNINIMNGQSEVHSTHYCHKCRNVMQRHKEKGEVYRHRVVPFCWSGHVEGVCTVCKHMPELERGGRKKGRQGKVGRPAKGSSRAAIHAHTIYRPTINELHPTRHQCQADHMDILTQPIQLVQHSPVSL